MAVFGFKLVKFCLEVDQVDLLALIYYSRVRPLSCFNMVTSRSNAFGLEDTLSQVDADQHVVGAFSELSSFKSFFVESFCVRKVA